jgi:hypothetical protein
MLCQLLSLIDEKSIEITPFNEHPEMNTVRMNRTAKGHNLLIQSVKYHNGKKNGVY